MSAKWTAVSFFTLTALGAASFAFAGCTVTSGTPNNFEGGTGNDTGTPGDTGTPVDGATDAGPNQCPGNTKQTVVLIDPACQAAAESACCSQLTACFDIVPDQDAAAGGTDDCNKFTTCIASCRFKADGVTPETDQNKIAECEADCDLASQKSVQDAYAAMITCITQNPTANAACQK